MGSILLGCIEPAPPGVRGAREVRRLLMQRQAEPRSGAGAQDLPHDPFGSLTRVHFHPEQQVLNLPLPKCSLSSLPSAKVNLTVVSVISGALSPSLAPSPCIILLLHQIIKCSLLLPLGITKYFITCRHAEIAACSLQLFSEQPDHEETHPGPAPH